MSVAWPRVVAEALAEDVGRGDWTSLWAVPAETRGRGHLVAKAAGVLAGTEAFEAVYAHVDPTVAVRWHRRDGDAVQPGERVAELEGPGRSLLTGERVALNFLQHLSGVATLTRRFVDAVAGTGVVILDTRKTTPGLRALEKAAVRAGGGRNHRSALDAMVLLKENHLALAGGIRAAVAAVRRANTLGLAVELEIRSPAELEEALPLEVDWLLLDNFSIPQLRQAVERVRAYPGRRPRLEASGGITLETVRAVAETGVDAISIGALTHSAPALDLSLLVEPA